MFATEEQGRFVKQEFDIETILKDNTPLLARIAATHEATPSLQEDLLQDISVAVWRALESFRGEANIRTFIAKIAHNKAVDHVLREKRHNDSLNKNADIEDIHGTAMQQRSDIQIDLFSALHRLSLGHRQVITMQLEGFNYSEIGGVLGLTESTVAKRASRARQQLEQYLGHSNG